MYSNTIYDLKSRIAPTRLQATVTGVAVIPLLIAMLTQAAVSGHEEKPIGPYLGHVDHQTAMIWYRPSSPGVYLATIKDPTTGTSFSAKAKSTPENDLCISWRFDKLKANRTYSYTISLGDEVVAAADNQIILTSPPIGEPARTVLAMGSCASSTKFFDVWAQIEKNKIDGLMLLGDTPYIDKTSVSANRSRHREFLSIPTLAKLGASTPIWGTWDDHDFGGNDTDGKVSNKKAIRKVFTEYRTQTQYGDGIHGVYTKFRRGPIEVFMIDPRYFSQTEPSPVDPEKPTCLGKKQWRWLLDGLKTSTAPFKLLATGMIWDDKKNGEKDDWETYAHEREAIFDFVGKNRITGVVLVGGDIHVSRHLKYPMKERIGYDLHQFIISPLHDRVIPSLNVPHPHLQWGKTLKNMFLTVTADSTGDQPRLDAKWIDRHGKTHRHVQIELDE